MSTKNLSRVATDVIATSGITATNVINTYRFGGERLFGVIGQRVAAAMSTGSDRVQSVVGIAVDLATKGVDLVATNAERFDRAANLNALGTLNRVALPAAHALSQWAERIEAGSSELVKRVAGKPVPAKAVATRTLNAITRKAAAARKKVVKTAKASRAQVGKAVAKTATRTSNAARRVARKAKAAA